MRIIKKLPNFLKKGRKFVLSYERWKKTAFDVYVLKIASGLTNRYFSSYSTSLKAKIEGKRFVLCENPPLVTSRMRQNPYVLAVDVIFVTRLLAVKLCRYPRKHCAFVTPLIFVIS